MFAKYVSNDIHLNIFFSYTYGIRAFSIAGQDKCSELTKKVDLLRHSSLNFGWLEQIFSWEREFATLERLKVPLLGDLESKVRKCPMGCISPPSSLTLYGKWCVWEFGVRGGYHPSGIWVWITWGPWLITRVSNYRAVAMLCPKHHAPFQSE